MASYIYLDETFVEIWSWDDSPPVIHHDVVSTPIRLLNTPVLSLTCDCQNDPNCRSNYCRFRSYRSTILNEMGPPSPSPPPPTPAPDSDGDDDDFPLNLGSIVYTYDETVYSYDDTVYFYDEIVYSYDGEQGDTDMVVPEYLSIDVEENGNNDNGGEEYNGKNDAAMAA
ncbi:hypothetical protein TWF696_003523 [Orbilia brochopaga]|uniref:Uncharacterized protein n=1 Tax=Orbilia brochopaga TaxID=3140254 RepID=A0AAV9TZR3_9PEZI